ncbi:MAG: hypothetical protein QXG85_04390, partial [Thermoproteota archaeon]
TSTANGTNGTEITTYMNNDLMGMNLTFNPTQSGTTGQTYGMGGSAQNNGTEGIVIIRWYRGQSLLNP